MTQNNGRALVVEDDRRISEQVCTILTRAGFETVDVAETAESAEARLRSAMHGLLLVDLGLPDRDGVELIRSVRASAYAGSIVVVTSATGPERILAAMHAGADGYLFKENLDGQLAAALRHLVNGGAPFSLAASQVVLDELRRRAPPPPQGDSLPALTGREQQVLQWLSTGASYLEIGRELGIKVNTVRSYIRSLYDKIGVQNGAEAVNLAWNLGLLGRGL